MSIYKPLPVPSDPKDLPGYFAQELLAIEQAINVKEFLQLQETHVEPERVENGIIYLADGTDWNPGSGRGIYWYDGDAAAWKLLG